MSARPTDNLHDRDAASAPLDGPACDRRNARYASFSFGIQTVNRDQATSDLRDRQPADTAAPAAEPSAAAAIVRDLVRDEVVLSAQTWVVKVGTSVLTGPDGTLDPARIDHLAEQISTVMDQGRKVALVSSGAVGAGMGQLGWKRRPDNLPPAPGRRRRRPGLPDPRLRRRPAPAPPPRRPTAADPRRLRQPAPLPEHAEHAARPVRVRRRADHQRERHDQRRRDQVRRQRPAGRHGHQPAPGAAAGDPERGRRALSRPSRAARTPREIVPLVPQIDDQVLALAGAGRSSLGTGGMQSKLAAARLVTQAGGSVIIASGTQPEPLTRILAGEPVGTLFLAHGATHRARKRWIGLTARPRGHYVVDAGARSALESGSKSLLAIGIVEVVGEFEKGDVVGIRDRRGQRVRPRAHELRDSRRPPDPRPAHPARPARRSARPLYDEVVHRDNLVLIV